MGVEKIDLKTVQEKNIFRPVHFGDLPKKFPIPNPSGKKPDIDLFLNSLNLPENWRNEDCVLHLHISHKNYIEKMASGVVDSNGNKTRYRDFLILWDEDIPKDLFYVGSIFDLIENLERLKADETHLFSAKDEHTLKYLKDNRYKTA